MSGDAAGYKEVVAREWNRAADGWHAWVPFVRSWLAEPTTRMLDRAILHPGARVLDVAAGDGDQSIDAARRVVPEGCVVAIDTSREMMRHAADAARATGLPIETRVADVEALPFDAATFDAAISRLGVMFCASPVDAFRELRRVVRPGGRVAVIVFATAGQNPFFAIPVAVIRRKRALPPVPPRSPGPFALGDPGVLHAAMESAGFVSVVVEEVDAPVRMASAAECLRFRREASGTLGAMMAPLDEAARAEAWAEMQAALAAYESEAGFVSPCTVLLGSASVPEGGS